MRQTFNIDTVLPGWGISENFIQKGQFLSSLGVDPEMPKDDSTTKPCGFLRPTCMAKFSGTEITGAPVWIEGNNKNSNHYVYTKDGKIHVIDSTLAMATALNGGAAITGATGNGLCYYRNYLYFGLNTDVGRYGPLDGTPTLVTNFWTSGLSKTALSNKTYPSIKGIQMPNHPMFVSPWSSRLYFGDVDSNGIGIISMIKTRKVTAEGDTDDNIVPSTYKVLDLDYGMWPTAICNLSSELAIGVINGTDTSVKQGNAAVVFWSTNPSDTAYNRIAPLPDPLITAMKNVNGQLYVFSGSASGGMRVSRYLGGEQFEEIAYFDDQVPPFQGAVDYLINRIIFGASTSLPEASASVIALGSKVRNMSMGVQNIAFTNNGTLPLATAVKYVKNGGVVSPIVGWTNGDGSPTFGLSKISTTHGRSTFRSQKFNLGTRGSVSNINIPFAKRISSNMAATINIYADDNESTPVYTGYINTTTCPTSDLFKEFTPATGQFKNSFIFEIVWTGTALLTIGLPISITVDFN